MYRLAPPDAWLVLWLDYLKVSEIVNVAAKVGWGYRNALFWCNSNPHPAGGQQLLQAVESALLLSKGNPTLAVNIHEQVPNFFNFPVVGASQRFRDSAGNPFNRAEKPTALLRLWIKYLSKPGDWVLDAFSGSGACAEAALDIGRNVVAVEAEEAQAKAIQARLLRLTKVEGTG